MFAGPVAILVVLDMVGQRILADQPAKFGPKVPTVGKWSYRRWNIALALAFSLVFAAMDEYHQTFVPGRGGTWTDVAIDGIGASVAALTRGAVSLSDPW
jgi:VanZ like family